MESPDAGRFTVLSRPVPGGSREWLSTLQTFPGWFQTQTTQQIRSLLSRDLREKSSVSAVTIGWGGRTILRLVTQDRELIMLAIGMHDDFAIDTLVTDVDSLDLEPWDNLCEEKELIQWLHAHNYRFRFPEIVTDDAVQVMNRCPEYEYEEDDLPEIQTGIFTKIGNIVRGFFR